MRVWLAGVCLAVGVLGASGAGATVFIVNVDSTPTLETGPTDVTLPRLTAIDMVEFPGVTLHAGDSLDLTIDFGETLQFPTAVVVFQSFGISSASNPDGDEFRITSTDPYVVPASPADPLTLSSFSVSVGAYDNYGHPSPTDSFTVDSFSLHMDGVPEPNAWALWVAAMFGLGAALRLSWSPRRPSTLSFLARG